LSYFTNLFLDGNSRLIFQASVNGHVYVFVPLSSYNVLRHFITYSPLFLPFSLSKPHSGTSSSISYSPIASPITFSSSDSPLCTSITPSVFHSRLKTYLFHKSYPPVVSLFPPGLPPRIFAWIVSSELFGFYFIFFLIFSFLGRALD